MTAISVDAGRSSGTEAADQIAPIGGTPFMLTLCGLPAHTSVRPPQPPHLKSYTFFMSRSRRSNGSERLQLHMGFFSTLVEAQQWAQRMRSTYPNAAASLAPAALYRAHASSVDVVRVERPQHQRTHKTSGLQEADAFRDKIDQALDADRAAMTAPKPALSAHAVEPELTQEIPDLLPASQLWVDPDSLEETLDLAKPMHYGRRT